MEKGTGTGQRAPPQEEPRRTTPRPVILEQGGDSHLRRGIRRSTPVSLAHGDSRSKLASEELDYRQEENRLTSENRRMREDRKKYISGATAMRL